MIKEILLTTSLKSTNVCYSTCIWLLKARNTVIVNFCKEKKKIIFLKMAYVRILQQLLDTCE